jgi:hypothetical protein
MSFPLRVMDFDALLSQPARAAADRVAGGRLRVSTPLQTVPTPMFSTHVDDRSWLVSFGGDSCRPERAKTRKIPGARAV